MSYKRLKSLALSLGMAIFLLCGIWGCSDADNSRRASGGEAVITMYSGGQPVKTYTSTGRVKSESDSDGWYFVDKATGRMVIVTGECTIEYK